MSVEESVKEGIEEDTDSLAKTLSRVFFYVLLLGACVLLLLKLLGTGCACKTPPNTQPADVKPPCDSDCKVQCPSQSASGEVMCTLSCVADCAGKDVQKFIDLLFDGWLGPTLASLAGVGMLMKGAAMVMKYKRDRKVLKEDTDTAKIKFDSVSDFGVESITWDPSAEEGKGAFTITYNKKSRTKDGTDLFTRRVAVVTGVNRKDWQDARDDFAGVLSDSVKRYAQKESMAMKDAAKKFNKGTLELNVVASQTQSEVFFTPKAGILDRAGNVISSAWKKVWRPNDDNTDPSDKPDPSEVKTEDADLIPTPFGAQ